MLRKIAITAAVPLTLVCGSAWAMTFDSIDENNDDQITKEEFTHSQLFRTWDDNSDGKIARDEIRDYEWAELREYDDDDNDYLDEDEFYDYGWNEWGIEP